MYNITLAKTKGYRMNVYTIAIDGFVLFNFRWTTEDIRLRDEIIRFKPLAEITHTNPPITHKNQIYEYLDNVLCGGMHQTGSKFVFLSPEDKEEIRRIVRETFDKPEIYG